MVRGLTLVARWVMNNDRMWSVVGMKVVNLSVDRQNDM